ncbi:MAG: hypothetical protein FIB07_13460 [Candidatus Methanoperedens sp.]|nr:hypothetical protein [Candidatus Methanoperedens sp.]
MKNKKLILSGILLIAFIILEVYLFIHTTRPPANDDIDFNITFRYGVEGKNELNTFKGTYMKDMVIDPSITVNLSLTKEEKQRIYQKMNDTNFFDYPGYFPQRQDRFVTPNSVYRLKVEYDSKIKEVSWDDNSLFEDENIEKGLNEIKGLIIEIIEDKEEYKIIPTPRALYL